MTKEISTSSSSSVATVSELRRVRLLPVEGVGTSREQSRIGLSEAAAEGVSPLLQWLQHRGYDVLPVPSEEAKYDYCTDHEVIVRPPLAEEHVGQLAAAFVEGDMVDDWGLGRVDPRHNGVIVIDNVSTAPFDHIDTRAIIDSSLQRELYATDSSARLSA
jgi:hypothetical protein